MTGEHRHCAERAHGRPEGGISRDDIGDRTPLARGLGRREVVRRARARRTAPGSPRRSPSEPIDPQRVAALERVDDPAGAPERSRAMLGHRRPDVLRRDRPGQRGSDPQQRFERCQPCGLVGSVGQRGVDSTHRGEAGAPDRVNAGVHVSPRRGTVHATRVFTTRVEPRVRHRSRARVARCRSFAARGASLSGSGRRTATFAWHAPRSASCLTRRPPGVLPGRARRRTRRARNSRRYHYRRFKVALVAPAAWKR